MNESPLESLLGYGGFFGVWNSLINWLQKSGYLKLFTSQNPENVCKLTEEYITNLSVNLFPEH
ncbi:hypothetical protein V2J09_022620 [Rumex salicifolius]